MQFHTKLKTTSTGNNTLLFIPHTKPKNLLCNKYSDILFRFRFRPDSSFISGAIRFRPDFKNCYPVHPWYSSVSLFIVYSVDLCYAATVYGEYTMKDSRTVDSIRYRNILLPIHVYGPSLLYLFAAV